MNLPSYALYIQREIRFCWDREACNKYHVHKIKIYLKKLYTLTVITQFIPFNSFIIIIINNYYYYYSYSKSYIQSRTRLSVYKLLILPYTVNIPSVCHYS